MHQDLTGKQFNSWTALQYLGGRPARWLCQCICGRKYPVFRSALKNGKSRQCIICGAQKRPHSYKDLSGQKFGKWTVLCRNTRKQSWNCRCDCGALKVIYSPTLLNGTSTRCAKCGAKKLPPGEAAFRKVCSMYRSSAAKRGITWGLTNEQVRKLVTSLCHYTGLPPANISKCEDGDVFIYNGIDRVDNDKGYSVDNCVPCSRRVNRDEKRFLRGRIPDIIANWWLKMSDVDINPWRCQRPCGQLMYGIEREKGT